jgi:NDMA-dependent alcohol dehydrogenase
VFSFLPSCGHCRWCASGQQNLCDLGAGLLAGSRWEDPTDFRLKLAGTDTPVGQMCGISTFVETTTVSADSAVKVDDDLPLDKVCLLGCNVGTGWGSAVNSARVQPGHTVIVMGIGGVGINAIQGASHAGAANVIAVDPVAMKRENAQQVGATHGVETMEEATELAKSFTNGQGADSAIITVGVIKPEYVGQAMASIRKAGTVVVTALGNIADTTPLPVSLADVTLFQKRIQGSLFGESNPNWDILRQVELYRSGVLKLDEVITKTYSLDQIAQGYQDMHDGKNQKGVVVFD